MFSGGDVLHDSGGAENWDEHWQGILQPGEVYSLSMNASSSRSARELPGGNVVTQDGSTVQTVSFTLSFDASVVPLGVGSMGQLKAEYAR